MSTYVYITSTNCCKNICSYKINIDIYNVCSRLVYTIMNKSNIYICYTRWYKLTDYISTYLKIIYIISSFFFYFHKLFRFDFETVMCWQYRNVKLILIAKPLWIYLFIILWHCISLIVCYLYVSIYSFQHYRSYFIYQKAYLFWSVVVMIVW
jgi:hypothetical protein